MSKDQSQNEIEFVLNLENGKDESPNDIDLQFNLEPKSRSIGSESPKLSGDTQSNILREGIITIYYAIKVNDNLLNNQFQIKSMNLESSHSLVLKSFNLTKDKNIFEGQTEFIVYLNIEFIHSAILTHVLQNLALYHNSQDVLQLNLQELQTILQNSKKVDQDLINIAELIIFYCDNNSLIKQEEIQSLINLLSLQKFSLDELNSLNSQRRFHKNNEITKLIDILIDEKSQDRIPIVIDSKNPEQIITIEDPYQHVYEPILQESKDKSALNREKYTTLVVSIKGSENKNLKAESTSSDIQATRNANVISSGSQSASAIYRGAPSITNIDEESSQNPSNYKEVLARTLGSPSIKRKSNSQPREAEIAAADKKARKESDVSCSLENLDDGDEVCNAKVPLTNFNVSLLQKSPHHHLPRASLVDSSPPIDPSFTKRNSDSEFKTTSLQPTQPNASLSPLRIQKASSREGSVSEVNSPGLLNLGRLFRASSPGLTSSTTAAAHAGTEISPNISTLTSPMKRNHSEASPINQKNQNPTYSSPHNPIQAGVQSPANNLNNARKPPVRPGTLELAALINFKNAINSTNINNPFSTNTDGWKTPSQSDSPMASGHKDALNLALSSVRQASNEPIVLEKDKITQDNQRRNSSSHFNDKTASINSADVSNFEGVRPSLPLNFAKDQTSPITTYSNVQQRSSTILHVSHNANINVEETPELAGKYFIFFKT